MPLRLVQVNIKARDEVALGRFWADALGWGVDSEGPGVTNLEPFGFHWPHPSAVCVDLVRVADPTTLDYRVHLDLAPSQDEDLVARLVALGATRLPDHDDEHASVLADPEGNVFRVLSPDAASVAAPVAAVVVHCADPRAQAVFWDSATDWELLDVADDRARLRSSAGVGPVLELVRGPEQPWTSHLHLDVMPYPGDDQAAEVARLRTLGAHDADVGQGDVPWVVMRDPEGHDFCVLSPR